jgi:hypothetical protein
MLLPVAMVAAFLGFHFWAGGVVSRNLEPVSVEPLSRLGIRAPLLCALDDASMKTLADSAARHPHVRAVTGVRRIFPSGFEMRIEPRRPWIAVQSNGWLYALDEEGVRIEGRLDRPIGGTIVGAAADPPPAGTAWKGEDVCQAFEMARLIRAEPVLRELVTDIDVGNVGGRIAPGEPEVSLVCRSGARIHWGRAPSRAGPLEPTVREKLRNLELALRHYPSLAGLEYVKVYIRNRPTVRRSKSAGALSQG